jgi:hypothetical protein
MTKLFLLLLLTNSIFTGKNLDCFIEKVNKFQNIQSIDFLQGIISKGEDIKKEKVEGRVLLKLDDENGESDFSIKEEIVDGTKVFLYQLRFYISKPKFFIMTYEEEERAQPEFDGFWYKMCLSALLDFTDVVKEVIEVFCREVSHPNVFGDFLNVKIGHYYNFYNVFRLTYQKMGGSGYNRKATYLFEFTLTTDAIFQKEELLERIAGEFEEKFGEEKIKMMNDIVFFRNSLTEQFSQWAKEIKANQRFDILDTVDNSKMGLKMYLGRSLETIKDESVSVLLENAKKNIYRVNTSQEFHYWINYINYAYKIYNVKTPLYYTNIVENISIGCHDVLKKIDFSGMLSSPNNFDKCKTLVVSIFEHLRTQLPFDYLTFNSGTFSMIKNKIKLWMVEKYDPIHNNYYTMDKVAFAKAFGEESKSLAEEILTIKKKTLVHISKKLGNKYVKDIYYTAFLFKWDSYINANPDVLLYFLSTIENKYGGLTNILNNMEVYLAFCLEMNQYLDEMIKNYPIEQIRTIFYDKFVDKLTFTLMIKFQAKKHIIKSIVPAIFELNDIYYQNYYYYYDIVSIRFIEGINQIDWDSANEDTVFIMLKSKLKRIITDLKIEIDNITHFVQNNPQFQNIDINNFRNLVLHVMIKKRDTIHYFKTNVYDRNITSQDEELVKTIINEYKNITNTDLKILELPKDIPNPHTNNIKKIENSKKNIIDKLFYIQGNSENKVSDNQIRKYIKFIIDHFDYLPTEIKDSFTECTKNDAEDTLEIQCLKIYGNQDKCRKLNPALISSPCGGYINGDDFNKCNIHCPKGFKSVKDRMCLKPDVYFLDDDEEVCQDNYEEFEGLCFPRCPFGWKDMGKWCEKPNSELLEKHYHSGFLEIENDKI